MTESWAELRFNPHEVSFLTDDIIVLRYAEIEGHLRKVLAIVKMRRSAHSTALHEFEVTSTGMLIKAPITRYEGILTGAARRRMPAGQPWYPGLTEDESAVFWPAVAIRAGNARCDLCRHRPGGAQCDEGPGSPGRARARAQSRGGGQNPVPPAGAALGRRSNRNPQPCSSHREGQTCIPRASQGPTTRPGFVMPGKRPRHCRPCSPADRATSFAMAIRRSGVCWPARARSWRARSCPR